ncbi:Cna B domain protein [Candidatus Moduliflexus flocculans]|uniref:Cna B domain protein n=1 Tax=Candidatus Moduliflexus flocculans TaxID=1499966 RepID=A0A0S6VSL9_9BACT|nr:Cna B domain protein [Candidatus Moduliflexus flocculans]
MKKIVILGLILITTSIIQAQKASAYSVTLTDFGGRDTEVTLDITQTSTSKVQVNAQVSSGIADIQGLFFNFTNILTSSDLKVTGTDVTKVAYNNDAVVDLGNGVTMQGTSTTFDLGVKIGTSGIGKDDIQSTSFTIESLTGKAVDFDLTSGFGARLTSVGANRQESRKLVGTYTPPVVPTVVLPTAVPEPTTFLLVGVGILGLMGLRKKMMR